MESKNSLTLFDEFISIDAEINHRLRSTEPKNWFDRKFRMLQASFFRNQLKKKIEQYLVNSIDEVHSFFEYCWSMYPPYGEFSNIKIMSVTDKSVDITVDNGIRMITASIHDTECESFQNKEVKGIIHTISLINNERIMIASTILFSNDVQKRVSFDIKSFEPIKIIEFDEHSKYQAYIVYHLHKVLTKVAKELLYEVLVRSERIEI